jgi:hypothetical protein
MLQHVISGAPHRKSKTTTSTKYAMCFRDGKLWIGEVMYAKADDDTIKGTVRERKAFSVCLCE